MTMFRSGLVDIGRGGGRKPHSWDSIMPSPPVFNHVMSRPGIWHLTNSGSLIRERLVNVLTTVHERGKNTLPKSQFLPNVLTRGTPEDHTVEVEITLPTFQILSNVLTSVHERGKYYPTKTSQFLSNVLTTVHKRATSYGGNYPTKGNPPTVGGDTGSSSQAKISEAKTLPGQEATIHLSGQSICLPHE
ncbi:hypothetical protein RRG08_008304 [Elysia crispata]|uniref:Uncharacterized protein n=1 Tax=Elysia crispata TaxID=231223 RepID=A0AAE1DIQ2_9GAST|nr:hypothetical protein RRG08_008304 [Elysia crispata]